MTDKKQQAAATPVAVVAMTAIYPGEPGLEGYWRTLTGGRDAISDVPPSHWLIEDYFDPDPKAVDRTYCKRGGFIDPVHFDPVQFGLPPNALPATDSAQILALIAAKQVLDKATRGGAEVDLDRVDVVLGVASTTELVVQMSARLQRPIWRKAMLENGLPDDEAEEICRDIADHYPPWVESTFPGLLGNVVAGRVANRLNLGGSNFVTDAACASSLSALQVALHRLYLYESDLVLTGGVDALNDVMMYMCFSKTPAFSQTGDCRPFSDAADGTIIGEGVGMLALKRLSDAERDGDEIHAVIRGLGSSSDGRASSVYAPRSEGQAKALRRAYERAGYEPSTVGLLEAHGTATKAGDVAEFAALKSVFTDVDSRCAIGSVKSQIGHTKAAAGAAGLIKAVLALQHSTLPSTLKVERPNPALGLAETPFYINAQTRPWVRTGDRPRRASVSSFGFGGSNFHVTLEEYRGEQRAKRLRILPTELVVLSASSEADLEKRAAEIVAAVRAGESLARIAFESAGEFDASRAARAGLVAADTKSLETLAERLRKALAEGAGAQLKDPNIAMGFGQAREGKTAFLFPGQGSQYVGMGADLALDFPEALAVWDGLDGDLADLHGVVFPEPGFDASSLDAQKAELTAMANAQPAIATTSLAQLALLDVLGVTADAAAGHSFGEVTALAAAGVIPMERLVETARTRGVLMAEAGRGKDGAMLAIAASAEDVRALLDSQPQSAGSLVMANDNAPQQVVLAGHASDIAWAEAAAKSAGWTSRRLPVASAFHSSIVAASSEPLATYLKTLKLGQAGFPVYANATAQPYGEQVADQLADQVRQPVKFREMIEAMARDGVTRFIEVGPGRVLTGLVGQILDTTPHIAVALDDPKAGGLRGWHRGLAALAADGVALDLVSLFDHYDAPAKHVAAPAHAVLVGGANLGKPYPPADGKTSITLKRARMTLPDAPSPVAEGPQLTPAVQRVDAPLSTDAWSVIDRIQKETAEQHQHYLDVMTQSHQAFLDVSAQMMAQIVGDHATVAQAPMSTPNAVLDVTVSSLQQAPEAVATPAPRPLPQQVLAPVSDHRPSESAGDVVLAIVSEKTGYPADMLGLGMEMEAELGIDSIKQVEILAALQARFPGAPSIPASELAGLRTLQDVVDSVSGLTSDDRTEHLVGVQHSAPSSSPSAVLCCTETAFRPVPPTGFAMAGLRDGEVFITREDPVFADALERVMTTHGIKARAVDDVPDEAGAVICLAALAAARSPEECVQMHVRAFHSARSVAKSSAESRLFVTVQSTGAGFAGADVPVGVASLVKTAAWEWPNASVRAIDIESLDAERLAVELVEGGSGVEVALRDDGARLVVVDDVEASPAGETISVAQGGVVVVTGGARGVTAESALALAARHGLRLALLGRTTLREASPEEPSGTTVAEIATALVASAHARGETIGLPQARAQAERLIAEREVRATLSAAQQQGTAARYFTTDITDRAELRKVLDEVRQTFGPIVGVVHGAGVLADKRLEDLDDDQFVRVFSTKLVGAEALLDATSSDDLRFISLFSSIAARAGNAGQSAYAAANATLETIAAREAARRGSACVVRAFGWGPWDGGMVDATLRSRFLDAGVGLIPIDEGAEFFAEQALCRSSAPAVVVAAPAEGRLRATSLEWDVSTENLPVLEDHQVRGRVVVPVVIVLDAVLRAARGLVAEACPVVRDFQVLSGVTFAASEKQALTLAFDPTGSSYTVTICDREGRPRYRAILDTEPDASPNVSVPEMSGSPWPMSIDDAYADYLFHGPRFAAIENLDGFGSAGGTGSLKGLHYLGWPESDWAIDPAIVDGGLQLGLLWASALGRSLMLPQRIGRVVLNRPFPENAVVRCRFAARPINDKRVDYDVAFETMDGARVAALEGVEFYAAGPTADASA
ncbi:SDR family NAD(P)-dependent oxidoreductase [Mycobacterium sp.]|uniref:SDR family NAD(P)-dependent oxidoreductase n=1 Tax=Mycobacterium sp. TaxID=1785 RepID=UPI002BC832F3|nr:SDR family NAD(P)-dependent oxidoreductase [Mycobacterium sp.]HTH92448.1 SDR family NAD(P)-dependent oxidoreductase [Mycobacterium sp.]